MIQVLPGMPDRLAPFLKPGTASLRKLSEMLACNPMHQVIESASRMATLDALSDPRYAAAVSSIAPKLAGAIEPHMNSFLSQFQPLGDKLLGQIQAGVNQAKLEQLEKTRARLSEPGVLDSLVNHVSGAFLALSEVFKGASNAVSELLTNNRADILELASRGIHQVTDLIESNPMLSMILKVHKAREETPVLAVNKASIKSTPNTVTAV